MDFRPFRPLRPGPGIAARVASPPYDVVSTQEARALAGADPVSFLRVTRPDLELDDDADPHAPEVYRRARATLERLVGEGALLREARPTFGVYRQTRGAHTQIGVVGLCSVADYRAGRVKKHEHTRPDKEDDRTHHIDVTGAQTGPVLMAMRAGEALCELLVKVTLAPPDLDVRMSDGVRHEVWLVPADAPSGDKLQALMSAEPACYIADGHHRAASAARVSELRRERGHGAGDWDHFLAVVCPAQWLEILPYNRVVSDLGGRDAAGFLEALSAVCTVGPPGAAPRPDARHKVALWLDGGWRELCFGDVDEADPIASLDVSLLQERVLGPLLGIADPRRDARIAFVGGVRGTRELEARAGARGAAFSMFPTSLDELLRVADQGAIMPPKSTWFEPKLADGLFVHSFEPSAEG